MMKFENIKNHERYTEPKNVGDMRVKECVVKYEKAREGLLNNKKIDNEKLLHLEGQFIRDDFEYWWYKVHFSEINQLIKLYKNRCKKEK